MLSISLVFSKKIHFFAWLIPFAFVEDTIEAFYTCVILHNMAMKVWLKSGDGSSEADASYDFVCTADGTGALQQYPQQNLALRYVQMEEVSVRHRAWEMEYLSGLGIHVANVTLPLDQEPMNVIPQYQIVAQYRWNQLYNGKDNVKLTKAIARELQVNYDNYKSQHK